MVRARAGATGVAGTLFCTQTAETSCPIASNSHTANIRRQFISFDPVA
jgi:hypothetical protein